jgi:predicted ferric reductase
VRLKPGLLQAAYLANLAIIGFFWWRGSGQTLGSDLASSLLAFGRLSALLGVYSILVQYLMISRARWLEPYFGLDRLTRWHHWNGFIAVSFIVCHVALIVLGYSAATDSGLVAQYFELVKEVPYVWLAALANFCLFLTIGSSIYIVRKHLKYEWWWYVHFLNYLVVILAIWHQLANGFDLVSHQGFRYYWIGLHLLVFGNLLLFRFIRPSYLYYKHRFRVEKVASETASTNSIYISGRNLDQFKYQAGQFAKWWFLAKGYWTEEHPFTISVEPGNQYLRLTPKMVGDFTTRLKQLKPGTPVIIDGAYGIFTASASSSEKLLFIAGGIGITPIRAILGKLQNSQKDMALLYSARSRSDLTLKAELEAIAKKAKLKITYILSEEKASGYEYGQLDKPKLAALVPDIKSRDVYICGPPPMMTALKHAAQELGVKKTKIHIERFSLH